MQRRLAFDDLLHDARIAMRGLLRVPVLALTIVGSVGLGIGAATAIFAILDAALLRPLPYAQPEQLVRIFTDSPPYRFPFSVADYLALVAQQTSFTRVAAYANAPMTYTDGVSAERLRGRQVSWTYFDTLGVAPALGRDFREDEDRVGSTNAIIISDRLWRDRFAARKEAVGQEILVDGVKCTIIGVMPPDFEFPSAARAWTTMQMDPMKNRGNHSWQVIGRLKPGVTVDQAQSDIRRIASTLETQYPNSNTGWGADVQTLRDFQVGNIRPVLLIMMAAVGFVLLIACANVANLLLARATARAKEMAVRVALGAEGWRVMRQLLTESVLVALAGATLGVAFAYGLLQWIKASILGGIPFWMRFTIDGEVLLFTIAVAVVTGMLFGLLPALQSSNPNLNETLRDSGARGASAGRSRQRLRSSLVVGEVALSLVLLVGAALLIRSFLGLQSIKPGFDADGLLTMRLTLSGPRYDSTYKRFGFWDRFLTDLNQRPGVVSAGIINNVPLSGNNNNTFFTVEDQPTPLGQEPLLEIRYVSPKYLETMHIPLRRGRMFTQQEWGDSSVTGRVAVVNEYMATKFWPKGDAIGKRFKFGSITDTLNRWVTIIGVAADIKDRQLTSTPDLQGYMPYRQGGWSTSSIIVRSQGDPARVTNTVLGAIKQADPLLPAYRVMGMDASIARSYWQQALYGKLFGVFAAIAVVLAAIGVYGVISYAVSQRTQEIGVRVALGAQRGDVLRLIVGHGALLGGLGVAIGLIGGLGVTRFLRTLLYGVSPFDPVSFIGVAALLTAIALLASYIPARRAAKVDPVEALRFE